MVFAGICAGGKGQRLGGDLPKQFLPLKGKPMIMHSVKAFLQCAEIERIFIAVSGEWVEYCRELFTQYDSITVITGGADRGETVARLADAAFAGGGSEEDVLATHDAARPFVTAGIIERCVAAAKEYGVSGTAVAATDTVLQCQGGFVSAAPDRKEMFLAQTPQCFRLGAFREVWGKMSDTEKKAATDVCGMFCRVGARVKIIEGDVRCFKITTAEDLERAERIPVL